MKLTDRFEASRDRFGWTLTEHYMGKNRQGEEKAQTRETYHANLKQVIDKIVEIEAMDQDGLLPLIERVEKIKEEITANVIKEGTA